jgi:uncharacterized protein (DUF433 family)
MKTSSPSPPVTASPDMLGGAPCFAGKRVPVSALFDYLKAGATIDDFLKDYPSISRAHALAVIDMANKALSPLQAAE